MIEKIWQQPEIIAWTDVLLDSYERLLENQLIKKNKNGAERAKELFFAPFVVVSHGREKDPILNYGNQIALDLWQMNWQDFITTPSRLTAEPINQEERQKILSKVTQDGFIDNYQGVRISSTGRRFAIEKAIIWNLVDGDNRPCGQAATFSHWSFLAD